MHLHNAESDSDIDESPSGSASSEKIRYDDSDEELWSLEWSDFPGLWPRRLLHIPTMTSLERVSRSTYGAHRSPHYGILTYTWGRWTTKSEPAIDIKGTTWEIPAVKKEHFSVDEFRRVINSIGQDFKFVWIDIACIDQENVDVKMDEIGNQMGIFKKARRVYSWLTRTNINRLQGCVDSVVLSSYSLHKQVEELRGLDRHMTRDEIDDAAGKMSTRIKTTLVAVEEIFRDPWFTSLWTLQESVLRRDARILTHEASPVRHPDRDRDMLLGHLVAGCVKIYDNLGRINMDRREYSGMLIHHPEILELAERVLDLIEKAGFHYAYDCTNPNVQYSAARFRQTKYPLDRIYGIMQLYGFRLGASANRRPDRIYTLGGLEDEFAESLVQRSPLLAQMFIHLQGPNNRKSWRITQMSRVPQCLVEFEKPRTSCEFTIVDDKRAYIKGLACEIEPLVDAWVRSAKHPDSLLGFGEMGRILLDDVAETRECFATFPHLYNSQAFHNTISLAQNELSVSRSLLKAFGSDSLRVFLLGFLGASPGKSLGTLLCRRDETWRRIGLCIWSPDTEKTPPLPADTYTLENNMLEAIGEPAILIKPVQEVKWHEFDVFLY